MQCFLLGNFCLTKLSYLCNYTSLLFSLLFFIICATVAKFHAVSVKSFV